MAVTSSLRYTGGVQCLPATLASSPWEPISTGLGLCVLTHRVTILSVEELRELRRASGRLKAHAQPCLPCPGEALGSHHGWDL